MTLQRHQDEASTPSIVVNKLPWTCMKAANKKRMLQVAMEPIGIAYVGTTMVI